MEAQSLTTCNQCGKKFQRKAHLLRHQQQHSGDRPYSCKFCSKTFKRSDVLRDHFSRCERRGSSAIPNSLERGRKRHACDECSRLKVKCDNEVPCRKCKEFGRVCVKSRPAQSNPGEASPSSSCPDLPATSDRNSIGFLLNCPEEKAFMREFPKSTTLSPSTKEDDFAGTIPDFSSPTTTSAPPAGLYNGYTQLGDLNHILSHLEFEKFEQDTHNIQVPGENMMLWQEPQISYLHSSALEQRALDIKEKLRFVAEVQNSPNLPSKEVMEAIDRINSNSVSAWITLYFRHWHKHAPIVHEATFNSCTAALPLVLALMALGGMYSKDLEEISRLKLLLDTIEGYIYSIPRFNFESDIPGRIYETPAEATSPEWQRYQLEELQGAYLVTIVQFWAGNAIARKRMRQQRVARIIAIFRNLGYQTVQHNPSLLVKDEDSFRAWVRIECIVRTVSWAAMLDNALAIFHNVGPRLRWSEIDLSFPGDNNYFTAASYNDIAIYGRPPEPIRKIKDAFLLLFSPFDGVENGLKTLRAGKLTAMDMQMMIHFLYIHFWAATFSNPLASLPTTNVHHLLQPFYTATRKWKVLWSEIKSSAPEDEWNKLGFQRTAEMYYEAVVLLLNIFEKNAGQFPPIPGDCEKWDHFKLLLRFEPGSILVGMEGN